MKSVDILRKRARQLAKSRRKEWDRVTKIVTLLSGTELELKLKVLETTMEHLGLSDYIRGPILEAYREQYDLVSDGLSVPWPLNCLRVLRPFWMMFGKLEPHPLGVAHDWLYKNMGPLTSKKRWTQSQCDKWLATGLDEWGHTRLDDRYYKWLRRLGWAAWKRHRMYDQNPDVQLGTEPPESKHHELV